MRGALKEAIFRALEAEQVAYALIGAVALAARGVSRSTADLDLLTTDLRVLRFDWPSLLPNEAEVVVRKGDYDDPLAGVITFHAAGEEPVDLVVGRWKWMQEAIGRAERLELGFAEIPVLTVGDLALTKIDAGGPNDLQDLARLVDVHGEALVEEIERRMPDLQEMRATWERFRRG